MIDGSHYCYIEVKRNTTELLCNEQRKFASNRIHFPHRAMHDFTKHKLEFMIKYKGIKIINSLVQNK